jgi:MFS family permease
VTGGVGALSGTWLGGVLADVAGRRDKRAYMSVPGVAAFISFPTIYLILTVKSALLCLALGVLPNLLNTLWYGPVYATAQSVVESRSRPTAAAILLFILNLIGLGLGPITVGALNDLLAGPVFGLGQAEGVRWAMIISGMAVLVAGGLFWWARATVREDIIG